MSLKTIKIEHIDQLDAGMKTHDGWEVHGLFVLRDGRQGYAVGWKRKKMRKPLRFIFDEDDVKRIFLNQTVEVTE